MKLIITIDTEEDSWGRYQAIENTCENVRRIPGLQRIFDNYNIKPTYLVTFPVVQDENARSILKEILDSKNCEIGMHCHPWSTPPFGGDLSANQTLLCNLPSKVIYRKLRYLHEAIIDNFSVVPVSFRAGRWGYCEKVAKSIYELNYRVDTSITPLFDWSATYGPNFLEILPKCYKFSPDNILKECTDGELLEVPASIGFLQRNYEAANRLFKVCSRKPLANLKLIGVLNKLKILNRAWLSPELTDCDQMIRLTKSLLYNNYNILNMVFHSSSLKHGINPFVKTETDEKRFLNRIEKYIAFAKENKIKSITLSEALHLVNNS